MKRVSTRKRRKENCAPGFGKDLDFTCYNKPDLLTMVNSWNKKNPRQTIKKSNPKKMWGALLQKKKCDKDSCLAPEKKEKVFSPQMPNSWKNNKNEWLDSDNLENVMNQYEDAFPSFDFVWSPSDYDAKTMGSTCVQNELCKFNLKKWLKGGKRQYGIIFNLDPHTKSGSHWVAIYLNADTRNIYYFDSTGEKIPSRIQRFVTTVKAQSTDKHHPEPFRFSQNHPVEHQMGDTECGIYTLYFISTMLKAGKNDFLTFQNIFNNKKHILTDRQMEEFRHVFFNP